MLGNRVGQQDRLFYAFDLEDRVPNSHLLRRLDAVLDLTWLRAELAPYYSHTGRPATQEMRDLIGMLGITYSASGSAGGMEEHARGVFDDCSILSGFAGYVILEWDTRDFGTFISDRDIARVTVDGRSTTITSSHLLVRSYVAVPESSTVALVATGVAGLSVARRRRKKMATV